ncbi:MAG TPA: prepilin peptidase [Chloroflexia bacterium]|nr:prepilin peptidase [Chloroflexia bacterium]
MTLLFAIPVFLAGVLAGFVINVIATRLAANRPLLGPLHCTRSPHPLDGRQVAPVIGYALQRGRCSTCGKNISVSYPLVELAMGAIWAALFAVEGFGIAFVFHALYAAILMLVLVNDWKHRDIYVTVIALGSVVAIAGSLLVPGASLASALIGAAVAGAFFALAYLLAKLIFPRIEEPLGFGDILLALLMGLMLGWPNVVGALLIGPLLAGAATVVLLVSRRRKLGDFIPYGVALCAAAILFLIYPGPLAEALNLTALPVVFSGFFGQ